MESDFLVEYVHGRHTVREYFERFVRERLFDAAFAIARTDPVWVGSNMRATFSKLRDQVKAAPVDERDVEQCWRTFVVALCAGDLEVFRRASEVLLRTGQLSVSAFVRTSLNLLDVSGWETDELAVDTLLRCDAANDARSTLDDIIKNGSLERARWAKKVLRRLGGGG
jgi:hypothetical protein